VDVESSERKRGRKSDGKERKKRKTRSFDTFLRESLLRPPRRLSRRNTARSCKSCNVPPRRRCRTGSFFLLFSVQES
jgi:hypothetical protein